jgi:hypothetical protein
MSEFILFSINAPTNGGTAPSSAGKTAATAI